MYTYNAKVIRIVDGDSIRMDVDLGFGCHLLGSDGRGVDIRLFGIDCPEIRTRDGARMGYWQRCASRNTSRWERRTRLRHGNGGNSDDTWGL